jgi:hypothetical protein
MHELPRCKQGAGHGLLSFITTLNQEFHLKSQAAALTGHTRIPSICRRPHAMRSHLVRAIQRNMLRTAPVLPGLVVAALSVSMPAAAFASEQRAQAPAMFPTVQMEGFELQRKNFRFGEFTGWLKRDGTWHIEGPVRHHGLLCGTYEVGMRFGVGERECTNVQWISEVTYVTSNNQCNDAERPHSGTGIDESLSGQFDAISCAERVIRCTGNCK